jgi:hypothetical protein
MSLVTDILEEVFQAPLLKALNVVFETDPKTMSILNTGWTPLDVSSNGDRMSFSYFISTRFGAFDTFSVSLHLNENLVSVSYVSSTMTAMYNQISRTTKIPEMIRNIVIFIDKTHAKATRKSNNPKIRLDVHDIAWFHRGPHKAFYDSILPYTGMGICGEPVIDTVQGTHGHWVESKPFVDSRGVPTLHELSPYKQVFKPPYQVTYDGSLQENVEDLWLDNSTVYHSVCSSQEERQQLLLVGVLSYMAKKHVNPNLEAPTTDKQYAAWMTRVYKAITFNDLLKVFEPKLPKEYA